MRLTIHQPEYMPWLGFFHKIAQADVFVFLDNVQYRHKYFQNRNRIRGACGELWLNVPVLRKARREQLINEVEINNTEKTWRQKNWKTICLNYKKSPFFSGYSDYFNNIFIKEWFLLAQLNMEVIRKCLDLLDIKVEILRASDLGVTAESEQLVLEICRTLKADEYISGISGIAGKGKSFELEFAKHNIKVKYDEFFHPIYKQLREPFMPCMSVIDLLFNHGPKSLEIINGQGVPVMDKFFL